MNQRVTRSAFTGLVLTGGRSSRMGVDKSLLTIDGVALARRIGDVLLGAGAAEVLAVGGDAVRLDSLGLTTVADRWPGEGPLGGLITGLHIARCPIVVALACDQPRADPDVVQRLVDTIEADDQLDAVVPVSGGYKQVLFAAYRSRIAPVLEAAFARGERSPSQALEGLQILMVACEPDEVFTDVDTPEAFARFAAPGDSVPE